MSDIQERAAAARAAAKANLERLAELTEQNSPAPGSSDRSWRRPEKSAGSPYGAGGKRGGRMGSAAPPPAEPRLTDEQLAHSITARVMAEVEARMAQEHETVIELAAEILAQVESRLDSTSDELRREVTRLATSFDVFMRMAGGSKPEPPRNDGSVIDLPPLPRRSMN